MTRRITATEARATFLALLDEVEAGEEIEITRRGRVVARLTRVRRPEALKRLFAGIVTSNGNPEDLYSTDETWDLE